MDKREVYFDNSATTRAFDEVRDIVAETMTVDYGNTSSRHMKGVEAENYIKTAREEIAKTLKVKDKEILFTSGGTESNNMALIGTALANKRAGNHIITSCVEHASIYNTTAFLEELGFRVTYLPVDHNGHVSLDALREAICDDTILVSVMYVNNEIGSQIGQGAKVAIVSDLSHFKIEGEIADTYGDRIAAGSKAVIKIGSEKLDGTVSDVTPLSKNGVISFTVQLEEDNHKRLRSGLKTDVYVMNAVKDDVLRIANSSYYVGKGEYELFVVNGNQLLKRKVQLGDSNFEYVEVVSGLQEGDQVIVSDMNAYKDKNKLKIED